jgi:hypothetical protein
MMSDSTVEHLDARGRSESFMGLPGVHAIGKSLTKDGITRLRLAYPLRCRGYCIEYQ